MTNSVPATVRLFLDIEAQVDREEDDEGYGDGSDPDGFIDDQEFEQPQDAQRPSILENRLPDRDEDGLNELLAGILERSHNLGAQEARYDGDVDSDDSDTPAAVSARLPTNADYPLLRVRCIPGKERDAVAYLFRAAQPEHMLRSIFSRDSVHGWFYIEAFMNPTLSQLLHSNHHLIRPQEGFGAIDMEEWTMTLDMDDERYASVGDWVTVRRGLYKGDVGYVRAIENWGQVSLLLVPRLPPLPGVGSSSGKRKRSGARTEPRLFTKEMTVGVAVNHGITRFQQGENDTWWNMFGRKFQHALELRKFHRHSVSSTSVSMPSTIFYEFQKSPHPDIVDAIFPCPSEWKFSEGERVVAIKPPAKRGIIKAIHPRSVEVDLETGEGIVNVPWPDLRKQVVIGNFAEVISGALCGEKGWVIEISGYESVRIAEWLERQEIRGGVTAVGRDGTHGGVLHNVLTEHQVHINWVKVIDPPLSFTTQQSTSSSMPADLQKREQVPWIKTEVIVCKVKHPRKGYHAIIKDVLPLQNTSSGLRISAQFTHVDPAHPFKTEILDYDDVVEASSGLQLYDFEQPLSKLFKPLSSYQARSRVAPQQTSSASGSGTPMPDYLLSSPAWNPSSRTPVPYFPETEEASCSYHRPVPLQPQRPPHPLLDSRLIGAKMKVSVTGGEHKDKEMVVAVAQVDGQLSIRFSHYNTSVFLPPEQVSPKHPNPTRDNGLLVVIEGDHCGKYVRRIHHRYEDGRPIIILAVIHRTEDGQESLSGEHLELIPDELCVSYETKEEKQRNNGLMSGLREEAKKTRAK